MLPYIIEYPPAAKSAKDLRHEARAAQDKIRAERSAAASQRTLNRLRSNTNSSAGTGSSASSARHGTSLSTAATSVDFLSSDRGASDCRNTQLHQLTMALHARSTALKPADMAIAKYLNDAALHQLSAWTSASVGAGADIGAYQALLGQRISDYIGLYREKNARLRAHDAAMVQRLVQVLPPSAPLSDAAAEIALMFYGRMERTIATHEARGWRRKLRALFHPAN